MRAESPGIHRRLELVFDWYRGMVSERTGRFVSEYEPAREAFAHEGSRIRELATVWDVELLGRFLDRIDLQDVCERSLRHFRGLFVDRDGALVPDPVRLGEPPGIAHAAFLLLATAESHLPGVDEDVRALADGLRHQQRPDGSFRVSYGNEADEGLEFYPGEAMLALMHAHALLHDAADLRAVEHGFLFLHQRLPAQAVSRDLRVFYANWQSQYAALLHQRTHDPVLRDEVRDHVFALHERVIADGFYERVARRPERLSTVEVACALEGLNDAYAIAQWEGDSARLRLFEPCLEAALDWLFRAQRLDDCTARERGGFGHSLADRTQRVDVTGHVMAGFVKSAVNGFGPP